MQFHQSNYTILHSELDPCLNLDIDTSVHHLSIKWRTQESQNSNFTFFFFQNNFIVHNWVLKLAEQIYEAAP